MNIHIIGGGNLGVAIALGISKFSKGNKVTVTRRNIDKISYLEKEGIQVSSNNTTHISEADIVILTIKPYQVQAVLEEILPHLNQATIASAVSGLSIEEIQAITGTQHAIVHIMPNIAARFGESATCISYLPKDKVKAEKVITLFDYLGTVSVIDEKLMDAATVLGACGTAYALRYIRASMQAGIEIGFDAQTALAIASQTAKGAATMALVEKIHPEQLIDRVTTPQGCTIVGLNEMEHEGFSSSLIKGIKTSLQKIVG
ncbi:pyrroline-5-carboxylate reductase [Flavobacterium branchiophilum NBRC 15030 = ATCC 35035]|uniref:Pyrroline-5-carboxylate reductase n=1 Tax=Flavobacterium branchiophilum TaxID=55197 RepID=A0A2H3KBC9_9FLAO|nr:pyrroline-5-carboxylate reductase [Flavobacterium branchiophilum]OXA80874.1 pyrroline-5-carboxylate reductase [Flavobacterium branchiophilum NBRC 15030 = ATCC 35035]PDS24245.1 pyrroline-5-carboxylate reductase [Flavobacterium branchiophilum]TQM40408.1 pyrroline-5-carboxylate reductase [Flavobacterium branchiophilum]GEM54489.1 pyrroline-5-carboxylate reductase [Flavobacterium branchiophilum NBRC 15030 = ATCC 35035]